MKILFLHTTKGWEYHHIKDDISRSHQVLWLPDTDYMRGACPPYWVGLDKPLKDLDKHIDSFRPDLVWLGTAQLNEREDVWDYFDAKGIPMMALHCNAVGKKPALYYSGDRVHYWLTERKALQQFAGTNKKHAWQGFGCNPNLFYPMQLQKTIDVSFGSSHVSPRRAAILQGVKRGVHTGMNRGAELSFDIKRAAPYQALNRIYNTSKINIGFSQHNNAGKLRHTEVMMAGGFYLAQHCEELELQYEIGRDLDTWSSVEELNYKVEFYLSNEQSRLRIAAAGLQAATNKTWLNAFDQFYEEVFK